MVVEEITSLENLIDGIEVDKVGVVRLEDWKDKAGGYGLQGYAAVFVTWIQGSFSSIIGLPLAETSALLSVAGIRVLK